MEVNKQTVILKTEIEMLRKEIQELRTQLNMGQGIKQTVIQKPIQIQQPKAVKRHGITPIRAPNQQEEIQQRNDKSLLEMSEIEIFLSNLSKTQITTRHESTSAPYAEPTAEIIEDDVSEPIDIGAVARVQKITNIKQLNDNSYFDDIICALVTKGIVMNLKNRNEYQTHIVNIIKDTARDLRNSFNVELDIANPDDLDRLAIHIHGKASNIIKEHKKGIKGTAT
ncbi:ORF3 [Erthesina fullo arlivirus 1]|uniref:ORF3 n=1 Tax=Erthesina fullo arlivirus 1 TaxID=2945982 RepID=UPI002481CD0E|nr:ORF3 [Erthesina fullo arlivirus 1]URA30371.1 ORF3 [Erthesina fullo arlivirus 1]